MFRSVIIWLDYFIYYAMNSCMHTFLRFRLHRVCFVYYVYIRRGLLHQGGVFLLLDVCLFKRDHVIIKFSLSNYHHRITIVRFVYHRTRKKYDAAAV